MAVHSHFLNRRTTKSSPDLMDDVKSCDHIKAFIGFDAWAEDSQEYRSELVKLAKKLDIGMFGRSGGEYKLLQD